MRQLTVQTLVADALFLFENESYESAVALSILAIEETGKPSIIRSILLEADPQAKKKEWQNYGKYTERNASWIVPELVSKSARNIEVMLQTVEKDCDHTAIFNNLKQLGCYTDAISKCKWCLLKEIIIQDLAESILEVAKIMIGKGTIGITQK